MVSTGHASETRLIVFDTNVIESRYLAPLLREETVRDLAWLRERGYMPAVTVKSVLEILYHLKKGEPILPWMKPELGYPGGIEVGWQMLQGAPDLASRENLFYWFGLCEEWRGMDWHEERELVRRLVRPQDQQEALRNVALREQFSAWKFRLTGFCDHVEDAIYREMHVLHQPLDRANLAGITLFDELSRSSIVPNEDLEILATAFLAEAEAFVTADREVLMQCGPSLSLNFRTAFVHPDQLRDAVCEGLDVRWSYTQTQPRSRGSGLAG